MAPDWPDLNQTQVLVFHSWINEYARVGNVIDEGGRRKVVFQEDLGHAAVGDWISSGDLRYLVVNNRKVLDMPGEFVCTQHGHTARVSWIPPLGLEADLVPVMAFLENLVEIKSTNNIKIEGLSFTHSTYRGLDRAMNWNNAAVTTRRVSGG